jgi:nitrite reductase/ring-hydroxylating ferredoxin subunit
MVAGVPVLLVRQTGRLYALHNRCTHRGGSLAEGELSGTTVTCPLHGSVFSLEDGSVERGPAAYPQPLFEARAVSDGEVEVRRILR